MRTENLGYKLMSSFLRFAVLQFAVILGAMIGYIGSAYFPTVLTPIFRLISPISWIQCFPIVYTSLILLSSIVLLIFLALRYFSILREVLFKINEFPRISLKHIAILFVFSFLIGTSVYQILYLKAFSISSYHMLICGN